MRRPRIEWKTSGFVSSSERKKERERSGISSIRREGRTFCDGVATLFFFFVLFSEWGRLEANYRDKEWGGGERGEGGKENRRGWKRTKPSSRSFRCIPLWKCDLSRLLKIMLMLCGTPLSSYIPLDRRFLLDFHRFSSPELPLENSFRLISNS